MAEAKAYPTGRFDLAAPQGGIILRDDEALVTNVVKDIMKGFGKNLVKGNVGSILKLRTPAYVHSPMSYLDCIKYEFCMLEQVLLKAQEQEVLEKPLERIKWITAAQIGAIHVGVKSVGIRSPLNPILGETKCLQTKMGSMLYMEQTSHHPPITHFHM